MGNPWAVEASIQYHGAQAELSGEESVGGFGLEQAEGHYRKGAQGYDYLKSHSFRSDSASCPDSVRYILRVKRCSGNGRKTPSTLSKRRNFSNLGLFRGGGVVLNIR